MKPLATAPLEQERESSTIVFIVPDDVLRMPLRARRFVENAVDTPVIGAKRIS